MTGRISSVSGPTVGVEMKGLRLYERVYVGGAMLTGEVVRLSRGGAVVQVYEDTRGLAVGEPVKGVGTPLTVRVGPGLLGGIFDGLQRPLERLREETGHFIRGGREIHAIDYARPWRFHPMKRAGDEVSEYERIGYVEEGPFKHFIALRGGAGGRLSWIADGEVSMGDAVGRLDDGRDIPGCHEWQVRAPRPYRKKLPPSELLLTGQRSIDFLLPIARGGAAILPGGFGTGKTVLEQSIAKFTDVDIVVYVGCGERGNEMVELIEGLAETKDPRSGKSLMERTVLVVNTSNMPVAAREASIYTAVAMAEYYRDMGYHVLLLADSLSRWAEALREISTTLEEMPGEEGYPTYLASRLSGFFERSGVVKTMDGEVGSLSMVLSISPPGADFTEPVTQACLRAAGALVMLDTALAHRRHFPAVNWSQSYSLYERSLLGRLKERFSKEWVESMLRTREILKAEDDLKEITEVVGSEGLQDDDRLLMLVAEMIRTELLSQNAFTDDAFSPPGKTLSIVKRILDFYDRVSGRMKEGVLLEEALKGEKEEEGN
jgi:V/A-type H+-transporting ATPase subunit A